MPNQEAEVGFLVEEVGYLALAVSVAKAYGVTTPRLKADIGIAVPSRVSTTAEKAT